MKRHNLFLLVLFRRVLAEGSPTGNQDVALPTAGMPLAPNIIKAVVPTSSGQIGVNPVDLVTAHSDYYFVQEGVTKWKGGYSDIVQTKTAVSNGATTVATKTAQIAVTTATVAASGAEIGDLTLTLSPAAMLTLEKVFTTAQTVCMALKIRRRQGAAFGACAIRAVEAGLPKAVTAGLEGSGIEIAKDWGASNLLNLLKEQWPNALKGLGRLVMNALRVILANEFMPVVLTAIMIMCAIYVTTKTMPNGFHIPKKIIDPYTPTRTTVVSSSTTDTYSYVKSHFMTDYFNPMATPLDTNLADAMANVLARSFSSLEAKVTSVPKTQDCIKTVLRNCQAVLEFEETKGGPKPCFNPVTIPAGCNLNVPGVGNPEIKPIPDPSSEVVVVWESPLNLQEAVKYAIYDKPYKFRGVLYDNCGKRTEVPTLEIRDPLGRRIEPNFRVGFQDVYEARKLPVKVKIGDFANKKNCFLRQELQPVEEPKEGFIECDNNIKSHCYVPTQLRSIDILSKSAWVCRDVVWTFTDIPLICPFT